MTIAAYIHIRMLATYVPTSGYKCSTSQESQYISKHSTKKNILHALISKLQAYNWSSGGSFHD